MNMTDGARCQRYSRQSFNERTTLALVGHDSCRCASCPAMTELLEYRSAEDTQVKTND